MDVHVHRNIISEPDHETVTLASHTAVSGAQLELKRQTNGKRPATTYSPKGRNSQPNDPEYSRAHPRSSENLAEEYSVKFAQYLLYLQVIAEDKSAEVSKME
ncbi:Protein of unknown function [Cotesia congregata]|uniref:Uncharacterized protein n=1 Tax=Cotesia congregata TaxID=51543 RepID=A0A8J2EIB4_COTCN|nr:Protein of unknown function [Cotesia congregata]